MSPTKPLTPRARPASPDPSSRWAWVSALLGVVVYATSGFVTAWPLTVPEGAVAAATGAAVASLLGTALASTRVRTYALVIGALFASLLSVWLRDWLVSSELFASIVGPSLAMRAGDVVVLGLGALGLGVALRVLSSRYRSLAILEVAIICVAFASLVAAHRNGAIHRPFEIADPMLARGWDPTLVILVIGACASAVVALLLLRERTLMRSILHLAVIALLLAIVLGTTALGGVPTPTGGSDGLGLRDRQPGQEQGHGEGGGRGGPDFQDEYDQSQGQVPVALVLLHDDYSPPTGTYYFRQEAFSQFNGRRLIEATLAGVDHDVAQSFPVRDTQVREPPPVGAFRSTVETTVGLLADHPQPFGLESPILFMPQRNPDSTRFRRVYRVRSAVLTSDEWGLVGHRAGDPSWSPEVRAHYTRGPEDPRYRELAERIVSEQLPEHLREDDYARAYAISMWLSLEGTYSLRSSHTAASDPTAHFLFGDLTGYCVHFAHAAVFLMRSLGLPARVATGYMAPESSRRGGSAILLAGNASHAWPEVYLEGVGWVVVDVAPQQSLDPPPGPPDEALQQLLAEMLRGLTSLPQDGSEPPRPLADMARDLWASVRGVLLGLVVGLLLAGYGIKLARLVAPSLASPAKKPGALYRAALSTLAASGITRTWGESREAFAARHRKRLPSFVRLTERHAASAFGGRISPAAIPLLERDARSLRAELARAVPLWRRILGALDPFSWLRAR